MVKNFPDVLKIFQTAIKHINIFQPKALQHLTKSGFLFENKPSGSPGENKRVAGKHYVRLVKSSSYQRTFSRDRLSLAAAKSSTTVLPCWQQRRVGEERAQQVKYKPADRYSRAARFFSVQRTKT
jgi:hypothetical protein